MLRFFLHLALVSLLVTSVAWSQTTSPSRSTVTATAVGTVMLKPTVVRLSIPIKTYSESAWDAADEMRSLRQEIYERAEEMGPIDGTLRTFGYEVGANTSQGVTVVRGNTSEPKYMASCYVVADFPLEAGADIEETGASAVAQLEMLASLLPKPSNTRRSYSVSTGTSGYSSQQLDKPLAIYVAVMSEEERRTAFQKGLAAAKAQAEAMMRTLGVEQTGMTISQSSSYYSSSRRQHPVESVIQNESKNEVAGPYLDGIPYQVRISVNLSYELPGNDEAK